MFFVFSDKVVCIIWNALIRHISSEILLDLQEQASKHLKLLWSKAMVVSVEEKVPLGGNIDANEGDGSSSSSVESSVMGLERRG